MRVDDSVGSVVNRGQSSGVDIAYEFTIGVYDEFEMVSSYGFFGGLNDDKPGVSFLDK